MTLPYRLHRWLTWREYRWQIRRARGFIQRGRRGWADHDTWNMDRYLAEVIAPMLRHLADHPDGYPACPGYEDAADFPPGVAQPGSFASEEAWSAWLREMADWFDWYAANELRIWAPGLSEEQIAALIAVYNAKHAEFRNVVFPRFARHFRTLWT